MHASLRILDREIRLACAPGDQRRLQDLATALEARLANFAGDTDSYRRLVLVALSSLDEAQAASAALARAHYEIDRLNDIIATAVPLPLDIRGRVNVLRA